MTTASVKEVARRAGVSVPGGWEDGGLLRDKKSGVYMDRDKVHFLDHVGKHFKVKGPLNITRSPQGWPVVAQAGSSDINIVVNWIEELRHRVPPVP